MPHDEQWARMLMGEHSLSRFESRVNRIMPSNPRCKICAAPFGGFGGGIYRIFGRVPSQKNPTMCNVCEAFAERHPGGAEVDLSFLFADVRGSTSIAEGLTPTEYNRRLTEFFHAATDVLIARAAWIDKFVGDEIVVFFFPNGNPGVHHARNCLEAARELLRSTRSQSLPIGIGIHTGRAYVGTVGGGGVTDVTAVGDDVNVAARLASAAEAWTIVASEALCRSAMADDGESRTLDLKGKSAPMPVRVLRS